MENFNLSNIAKLGGIIAEGPSLSHEIYEEKFYKIYIEVKRLSMSYDKIPVIISERITDINELEKGKSVFVVGQFRSYNEVTSSKPKLVLSVFAKSIEFKDEASIEKINELTLEGFICKKPVYRETPLGREISDVLVAVNRTYKKSDYIPCILWGRNAKFSEKLEVGTKVKVVGRIQSRNYEKKINENEVIKNTAYELSVSLFSKIEEEV